MAERPYIAVAATFTVEALEPALAFWARELGWDCAIRFAPYNQVFQQLLDPGSLTARNRHGVNVLLVRLEDWARFDHQPSLAVLEENVRQFVEALGRAAAAAAAPLVVCLCPASPAFTADPVRAAFLTRMEGALAAGIGGLPAVYLSTEPELAQLYPVARPHDPHGDELGRIPYTPEWFAAMGTLVARKIHAMRTAPYKLIALDCDDTLWEGICGEDGPEGVRIDPPRRALQEFMLARQRAGMLLAIVSKNNEEDVLETFRAHPEMPLALEHFVARRINWEPKGASLAALARDLDLGLDSFILVDDNPKECTEVASDCPEVLALPLPQNVEEIPAFLEHVWAFDRLEVTPEDRDRTALYAQQAGRARLERTSGSLEEFLAGLKLEVRIEAAAPQDLPRVAQLTQRTSQMNVAPARRSEAEILELLRGGAECLVVRVSDRFGSYGLTGVLIFRGTAGVLKVDTFLLSCRALGRGVEHRMLAALGELAEARDLERVEIPFAGTHRNRPALRFLESVGTPFEEAAGESRLFHFPAAHAAGVVYRPGAAALQTARPAVPGPRAASQRQPVDYVRLATQLRDPQSILDAIRRSAGAAVPAPLRGAGPRTDIERRLAGIWMELLNVSSIGVNDNFFDLGGHSLLAVQVLSRVRAEFGVDLSLEVVYSGEFTIAELARAMELKEIEQAGAGEYQALLEELEGLSDEEVRALLAEEEAGGG
jgi:FkbH-like protein